jgi:hypothetical protein
LKFAHLGLNIKLALPSSKTPGGTLAEQVLDRARSAYGRDWWANAKRNTTVTALNSADAVEMVSTHRADAALALSSTLTEGVRLVPIPPDLGSSIDHFVYGRSDSRAQSFVEYLYSKGNQQRLVAAGFSSPLSPVGELVVATPTSITKLFTAALPSLAQDSVKSTDESGKRATYRGASISAILSGGGSEVRFISADGTSLVVPMATLRKHNGVLAAMPDGNFRVVIGGRPVAKGLRWIRRIEVK